MDETPTLTIDFQGLCAFVGDAEDPGDWTRVDVFLIDAERAIGRPRLCRHDPVLLYRQHHFESMARNDDDHRAFPLYVPELTAHTDPKIRDLGDQSLGLWDLKGKRLALEGVKASTKHPLQVAPSFHEVLGLHQLTSGDGRVDPRWASGFKQPGIAACLRIEHGRLSGGPHLTTGWGLGRRKTSGKIQWIRFRQSVRWEVFADPSNYFLKLATNRSEWIRVRPRNTDSSTRRPPHLIVSNLCPLSAGGLPIDEDVLAYYAMPRNRVASKDRLILHRKPARKNGGSGKPVQPTLGSCPPLRAYVEG